ncbi:hypothetical protein CLV96_0005 [Leptospira meyeri]|uniref:Uncharacterized protein n=1 Tax=Leptospira meyeri TaxID=29508 RepID=A0A4R8MPC1_LEPME|nr:hypothetical protein [Leptospira meyeri]TDY71050.1 hypothetical protein CLV96_0005 [Leptospira meyeri]
MHLLEIIDYSMQFIILLVLSSILLLTLRAKRNKQNTKEIVIPLSNIRSISTLEDLYFKLDHLQYLISSIESKPNDQNKEFKETLVESLNSYSNLKSLGIPPTIDSSDKFTENNLTLLKRFISEGFKRLNERKEKINSSLATKTEPINSEANQFSIDEIIKLTNENKARIGEELNALKFYSYIYFLIGILLFFIGLFFLYSSSKFMIELMLKGDIFNSIPSNGLKYTITRYYVPIFSKFLFISSIEIGSYVFLKSFFKSRKKEQYYINEITDLDYKRMALVTTYYTKNESIIQDLVKSLINAK